MFLQLQFFPFNSLFLLNIFLFVIPRHWLKATVTLTIVMGFTWLIGVVLFDGNLLFLAFIYTICIAFQVIFTCMCGCSNCKNACLFLMQGVIIFIVLVPLSKQV